MIMINEKHKLWDADAKLFASMKGNYQSNNEENFFKTMQYKQECETTALNELLVSEYENPDEIKSLRESRSDVIRAIMEPWIPVEQIEFTELARALNSLEVSRANRKLLAVMLCTYRNHNGHMLWNENSLGILKQLLFDILDISQKSFGDSIKSGNPDTLRRIVISKTKGFMIDEIDEICHILTMEV